MRTSKAASCLSGMLLLSGVLAVPVSAAQTCAAKGLRFAGDISTATHGGTCMCPWGLRSGTINNLASFNNECFP